MLASLSLVLMSAAATAAMPCETLDAMSTPQVSIRATSTPGGTVRRTGRGACRSGRPGRGGAGSAAGAAAARALPRAAGAEADIRLEHQRRAVAAVGHWNGKFMAVGNGGFGGSIQGFGDMQTALRLGYATAGNDTGHSEADGPDGMFALGHPEKIVDFAYRAMHEMTATSKKLIDKYYGSGAAVLLLQGLLDRRTAGRDERAALSRGLRRHHRRRAGQPAHPDAHVRDATAASSSRGIPRAPSRRPRRPFVTKAVLDKCDTLKEGFLNNPRACSFDFKTLACRRGRDRQLSHARAAQDRRAVLRRREEQQGRADLLGPGAGQPPAGASGPGAGTQPGVSDTVRIWGFQNADYDWKTFDLDRDMPIINSKVGFVDAVDPDLSKFKARGGKLLLYAGWGDTTITPENTVLYYENLQSKMGKNQDDWTRLFMVPGMGHCRGGDGPHAFDLIGTMEAWREKGVAPARITGFNPQSELVAAALPLPAVREVQGHGQLQGRRELGLHRAVGACE